MQSVSAITAGFSLYILIASARRTGAKNYAELAADAYGPRAAVFTAVLTLMLTFMALTAFIVLLKDLVGTGMVFFNGSSATGSEEGDDDDAGGDDGADAAHIADAAADAAAAAAAAAATVSRHVLLKLLVCVAFPVSLNRSLSGLKFVTPLSLASMFLLTGTVALRGTMHAYENWDTLVYRWWPDEDEGVLASSLKALPVCTLSYMCHFNALSMHADLIDPTRERLVSVIAAAITVSSVIYLTIGITGYLWAGNLVAGDVLSSFPPDDPLVNLGRAGLALGLLCNIPMVVVPARDIIVSLFFKTTGISLLPTNDAAAAATPAASSPDAPSLLRGNTAFPAPASAHASETARSSTVGPAGRATPTPPLDALFPGSPLPAPRPALIADLYSSSGGSPGMHLAPWISGVNGGGTFGDPEAPWRKASSLLGSGGGVGCYESLATIEQQHQPQHQGFRSGSTSLERAPPFPGNALVAVAGSGSGGGTGSSGGGGGGVDGGGADGGGAAWNRGWGGVALHVLLTLGIVLTAFWLATNCPGVEVGAGTCLREALPIC